MGMRYFEFSDGTSNKFWEIRTDALACRYTVRSGNIGTKGRQTSKDWYPDSEKMHEQAEKLIAEKADKGYVEKDMFTRAMASLPTAYDSIALFEEAKRLIRNLQETIEMDYSRSEGDGYASDTLPRFLKDAQRGGVAWKFLVDEIPFNQVDRRKSMLKGPFFITDKYPVPKMSDGEYMIPIIQADLRELSKLRGLPLGDGLIQAWWAGGEWECRVIPRRVIDKQEPLPFPMNLDEFWSYGNCFLEDWISAERCDEAVEDKERVVPVILGYCDPFVCIDVRIESDWLKTFVAGRSGRMDTDVTLDDDLSNKVINFKDRPEDDDCQGDELENNPEQAEYTRLIEVLKKLESGHLNCDHAFGSFHGIHARPHERMEDALFVFESQYFSFGGAGNAHVMYGFKKGKPYFYFNWANM